MRPSPNVYWLGRRRLIMRAPPGFGLIGRQTEQLLIQFADLFDGGLELAIVLQPSPDLRDLFFAGVDLTDVAARVSDRQHPRGMTFAARALRAALAMANRALE